MVRIRGPRCGLLHASSGWLATDTRTLSSGQACRARPSSPRAPLLQRHYPPSLLLRAHAQIPVPLISISCFALIEDALAACTTHGWSPGPSRFGPPFFPEVLRPLYRRFDECIQPVLPRRLRPSPLYPGLGSPQSSRKRLPAGFPFRYGRHSFMLRPSSLLALLAVRHLHLAPEDVLHPSLPSIRYLLDRRICYPADWSIAGAGLSPARKAAAVGCTVQTEIEVPPGHASSDREQLPVEMVLQHRGLPARRPCAYAVGSLAQSAFVDEDDGTPLAPGFFLSCGQRSRFQCVIACSLRSKARPLGR